MMINVEAHAAAHCRMNNTVTRARGGVQTGYGRWRTVYKQNPFGHVKHAYYVLLDNRHLKHPSHWAVGALDGTAVVSG